MSKTPKKDAAKEEKTRLEILIARQKRHLENADKIRVILDRQSAFLKWGTKAKARARFRDLVCRGSLSDGELKKYGWKPTTEAEQGEMSEISALFDKYEWNPPKDHKSDTKTEANQSPANSSETANP